MLREIYIKEVFRLHRLPKIIVSDRGLPFALEFWIPIFESSGIA
jgi:hypothetical protein